MIRSTHQLFSRLALAVAACAALPAAAHDNPVDTVSNPNKLSYTDVQVGRPELNPPFARDGELEQPARLSQAIKPGATQAQVQALLGAPLTQASGSRGQEWDYNLKFRLPQSDNYLVCQYKVVFDEQQTVRESVWRRRQCQDLAG